MRHLSTCHTSLLVMAPRFRQHFGLLWWVPNKVTRPVRFSVIPIPSEVPIGFVSLPVFVCVLYSRSEDNRYCDYLTAAWELIIPLSQEDVLYERCFQEVSNFCNCHNNFFHYVILNFRIIYTSCAALQIFYHSTTFIGSWILLEVGSVLWLLS